MLALPLILIAYLAGSLSAGVIVARVLGLGDPRQDGSGNPGATNLLRLGGRRAAAVTLLADAIKGVIPVVLAHGLGVDGAALAAVGLAAFMGHLYPVFFGFQGGKGIATGLGVMLAWAWPVGLMALGCWVLMAAVFRLSSLAALTSFALAPLALLATGYPALAAGGAIMALVTGWRHRGNIQRIAKGTEPRIGKRQT
ncbi:glycerol-3-phosphate 1-O-acyltransferase PlsY [Spiribacter pallidus]|jgi:glycerol-3-phosphate acyltransferase PlsY|uniref:Glycerol-3-phosphate acyltransferase n=1 Tax=Spiribacter pallidus TaxID=1987936 RepID=A0ABV3TDC3_9GAMM